MAILLDTHMFIDILRGRPVAEAWIASLPDSPLLSGVAALEASFGAKSASDLRDAQALAGVFRVIWPTGRDMRQAAEPFAPLRLSHGIGALDAVTAAMAIRLDLILATFNAKHFRPIPGLAIMQPYAR